MRTAEIVTDSSKTTNGRATDTAQGVNSVVCSMTVYVVHAISSAAKLNSCALLVTNGHCTKPWAQNLCRVSCTITVSSRTKEEHDQVPNDSATAAAATAAAAAAAAARTTALTMLPEGHGGGKSSPDELPAGKWQDGLVHHLHVPTRSNHREMFVGHGHHPHHPHHPHTPHTHYPPPTASDTS